LVEGGGAGPKGCSEDMILKAKVYRCEVVKELLKLGMLIQGEVYIMVLNPSECGEKEALK